MLVTDSARKVMKEANREAKQMNHEFIGTEHILLGIMGEGAGVGANVLKRFGVGLDQVRSEVLKLARPGPEMVTMGTLPRTPRAEKAIEYAINEARDLNHGYVGTEHLLLGLVREGDGVAAQVLREVGLELEEMREEVLNLLGDRRRAAHREHRTDCDLCRRLAEVEDGSYPWTIAMLNETGWVLGDNQGCRGWCVLILKDHIEHLADLSGAKQAQVFRDVARVAAAIREVFPTSGKGGGPPRINYECLGNLVPHVHWHVIPRHADDPEPTKPVWGWPEERLRGSMTDEERQTLLARLKEALSH